MKSREITVKTPELSDFGRLWTKTREATARGLHRMAEGAAPKAAKPKRRRAKAKAKPAPKAKA